jgi:predicted PurR-regulated permease PerM
VDDKKDLRWRSTLQLLLGLGLTYLFFYMMAPFLVPIVLAAISALLVFPLQLRLEDRIGRAGSALLLSLGLVVGILGPLSTAIVGAVKQVLSFVRGLRLDEAFSQGDSILEHPLLARFVEAVDRLIPGSGEKVGAHMFEIAQAVVDWLSRTLGAFAAGLPSLVLSTFVFLLSFYFFLVDGPRFMRFLASLSPLGRDKTQSLYEVFEKSCRGVVLGLFLSALIQATLVAIYFAATGTPHALLYATLALPMGMIPVVGTAPITVGGIIYMILSKSTGGTIVMILGAVLVSGVDNVVRSLVMKGQSEMHPMLALVSALGATNLVGFSGIFLGPIIAAVFLGFLKILALEFRQDSPSGASSGYTPPPTVPPMA